jgi:hypothetical protein
VHNLSSSFIKMVCNTIQHTLGNIINSINVDGQSQPRTVLECRPPEVPQIDPQNILRLCFQNVQGLHPRMALDKWMGVTESASKHNVGILGLSEINTNMALESNQREIKYTIRSKWKTHKMEAGTCIGETQEI